MAGSIPAVPANGSEAGTTYYVDSARGRDTNQGTSSSNPWKSLYKVNGTTFAAGDKILFKAGSAWTGTLHPLGSGKPGSPIVIGKYGKGNMPVINGGGAANAVYLSGQSHWEIDSLEVTNNAASEGDRRGIFINARNGINEHIYIKNCYIHHVRGNNDFSTGKSTGGIILYGDNAGGTKYNDILIQGNTIDRCDRTGILAVESCGSYSTNVVVRGNAINYPGGDGIIMLLCKDPLIEYNVCNTSDAVSKGVSCAIWPYSCDGAVFQYNEAYNSKLSEDFDDGQAWDVDGNNKNTVYQYNYSHDNEGGALLVCSNESCPSDNSTIRYNISQNDAGRIITLTGPSTNTYFYNNTIFLDSKMKTDIIEAQDYGGWHDGFSAYNNIFYNLGSGGYYLEKSTKNVFDYNVFYGKHPSTEPMDNHKTISDPGLVSPGTGGIGRNTLDGYRLKAASPCIDSGINIINSGGKDFWGNEVRQGLSTDRGAHEYASGLKADDTRPAITLEPPPAITQEDMKIYGVNLAKGKTAKASSIDGERLDAAKAVDGDALSRWASAEGGGDVSEWISVDLGSAKTINAVIVKWENAFAKAYKIQVSTDDTVYRDVAVIADAKKVPADIRSFPDIAARYVRIYCTQKVDADWGYSIYEFEVYSSDAQK